MTEADRQPVYLAAFAAAYSELDELLAMHKQLQIRKEQLEEATQALASLFDSGKQAALRDQHSSVESSSVEPRNETLSPGPCLIERREESLPLRKMPVPDESSDPIQRRINDALGTAAVA